MSAHPCPCRKEAYFSLDAAEHALKRCRHAGQVCERRRETRVYECEHATMPVWHLTSTTLAQYRRRQRVAMLAALDWSARVATGRPAERSVSLASAKAVAALGAASVSVQRPYSGRIVIRQPR